MKKIILVLFLVACFIAPNMGTQVVDAQTAPITESGNDWWSDETMKCGRGGDSGCVSGIVVTP